MAITHDSLLVDGTTGWHRGDKTITYSFIRNVPDYYAKVDTDGDGVVDSYLIAPGDDTEPDATVPFGAGVGLNAQEIAFARTALDAWSDVANVDLVEVADGPGVKTADITLGTYAFASTNLFGFVADFPNGSETGTPGILGTPSVNGDFWLNTNNPDQRNTQYGNTSWQTYLHELGHAFGLTHPNQDPDNEQGAAFNDNQYTVMSYVAHPSMQGRTVADQHWPVTPMLFDIAAIQTLYGANLETRIGDTTYFGPGAGSVYALGDGGLLENGRTAVLTVWDAGGIDTIDASNQTGLVWIDLNPGAFSSIGTLYNIAMASAHVVDGVVVNLIENATGGAENDILVGNDGANVLRGLDGDDVLTGGGGDDTLIGGSGNDSIDGGTGFDTAVFATSFADTRLVQGGATTIFNGAEGLDSLTNIDRFTFTDISIEFQPELYGERQTGMDSDGVQVSALYDGILGRGADAVGLVDFAGFLAGGGTVVQAAEGMLNSTEYAARFGDVSAETDAGFVTELYQIALGRAPDRGGLAANLAALEAGTSRAEIAANIALSAENLAGLSVDETGVFVVDADSAAAARLYFGLLDRAPDAGGVATFTNYLEGGAGTRNAAQAFLDSAEYGAGFTGLTDAAFVDGLYENALGRDADAGGFEAYMSALANGVSRADVAVAITQSLEAKIHFAPVVEQGWVLV